MGFSINNLNPFGGRGGNPFNAIKNEINDIKRKVNKIGDLERELSNLKSLPNEFGKIKGQIEHIPREINNIKNKIEHLPNEIGELKDKLQDIPKELKDELEKALGSAVGAAIKKGLSFGYKELKDNISILKGISVNVDFSVFTSLLSGGFKVGWGGFKERLDRAEKLAKVIGDHKNKNLRKRSDIIEFTKIIIPDGLAVNVSAVELDIDPFEGLDRFNYYLGKIGVPE